MKSKRIALVANTDWFLYNFRHSLIDYLSGMGYSVILISPPGLYADRLVSDGYRWIEWQVGRQSIFPIREWMAIHRLEEIYRSEKPDIVHHHTIKPVLYGSLAAGRTGVPRIVNSITGRGYVFLSHELKARFLRPLVIALYRLALQRKNCRVIFENNFDQDYFIRRRLIRSGKTWLIRSVGVDIQKFKPTPEPVGIPVVTMASRMLWDKGVGVFVDAARILQSRLKVRMVLVGLPDKGNPSSVPQQQLNRWVNEGVIEWRGWQEDMAGVYSSSNVYVLPSFYEGVPRTLLEAAACGRAIITSDIPGCREVIEDGNTGLLVPTGNPQALADAIERLASDSVLRAGLSAAARVIIVEQFSTEHVNQLTEQVYQG